MGSLPFDGIRSAERRLWVFLVPVEEMGVFRYVRKCHRHISRESLHQREHFCLLGACGTRVHIFCASPKMGPVYLISTKLFSLFRKSVYVFVVQSQLGNVAIPCPKFMSFTGSYEFGYVWDGNCIGLGFLSFS